MSDNDKPQSGASCSCFGCLGTVLAITAFWALLFGVTWNGSHYALSCDCSRGVNVTQETAP